MPPQRRHANRPDRRYSTANRASGRDLVSEAKVTLLTREYRGVAYRVAVTADGQYEFEGRMFPSLSMIAREITGTRWSGPVFFGIKPISTPKQKAKKGGQR